MQQADYQFHWHTPRIQEIAYIQKKPYPSPSMEKLSRDQRDTVSKACTLGPYI